MELIMVDETTPTNWPGLIMILIAITIFIALFVVLVVKTWRR